MSKLETIMNKIKEWEEVDKEELMFYTIEEKLHNSLLNYNRRLQTNLDSIINNLSFRDEIKTLAHINKRVLKKGKRKR